MSEQITHETPLAPGLQVATIDELVDALMQGLRYDGRRRTHDADEIMSRIVAQRLVSHLTRCGFVLTRLPGRAAPDTSQHHHPNAR